jgi:hypothetical protein
MTLTKSTNQAMQKRGRKRRAENEPTTAEDESTYAKAKPSNSTDPSSTPRPRPCAKKARIQTKEDVETGEVD